MSAAVWVVQAWAMTGGGPSSDRTPYSLLVVSAGTKVVVVGCSRQRDVFSRRGLGSRHATAMIADKGPGRKREVSTKIQSAPLASIAESVLLKFLVLHFVMRFETFACAYEQLVSECRHGEC